MEVSRDSHLIEGANLEEQDYIPVLLFHLHGSSNHLVSCAPLLSHVTCMAGWRIAYLPVLLL